MEGNEICVDGLGVNGSMLTKSENEIFESMVSQFSRTFRGKLYRDGVPVPRVYLSAPVRVLFVFREPNFKNKPKDWDMREQVRELAERGTPNRWWDIKVPRLGHAVVHALAGGSPSYARFQKLIDRNKRTQECLFPFGFIQIKKVGGGSNSVTAEIEEHANLYRQFLKKQIALYEPHLIIACGLLPGSPARLLNQYVLPAFVGKERQTGGFAWWRFANSARPAAMLEFNHPAARHSREQLYRDLALAVREIADGCSFNRAGRAAE
jgi:hypothetical protein